MSSSEQRRAANRANSQKSTGPATESGKAIASQNAVRHGLLSSKLLLDDECLDDFTSLQSELQATLHPQGHLELALVERITISLWRQRRLISAETAAIGLARAPRKIASSVSSELNDDYTSKLTEADLQPFDCDRLAWCTAVVEEVEKLETIDPASLPNLSPKIYEQLQVDAEEEQLSVEDYLKEREGGVTGYIAELHLWCVKQIADADKRPKVLDVACQLRAKRLVLPADVLEVFSRYQTTLDNQLYKALRVLRDAQEWRIKTLNVTPEIATDPVDEVA